VVGSRSGRGRTGGCRVGLVLTGCGCGGTTSALGLVAADRPPNRSNSQPDHEHHEHGEDGDEGGRHDTEPDPRRADLSAVHWRAWAQAARGASSTAPPGARPWEAAGGIVLQG
jgi:hypothetical protein